MVAGRSYSRGGSPKTMARAVPSSLVVVESWW